MRSTDDHDLSYLTPRIEVGEGCWRWTAGRHERGYGRTKRGRPAHRVVYTVLVGPIPEGCDLDHICESRDCVNPDHLEPVSHQENVRRASEAHRRRNPHCLACGGELRLETNGRRACTTCRTLRQRERRRASRN